MDIADFTFYVIDQNLQRRNALARLLSKTARAVPLDNVSEVGSVSAGKPCFLVYDEERQLQACLGEKNVQEALAAVLAYSEKPELERVFEILDQGAGGYFDYDGGEADPTQSIMRLLHRNAKFEGMRRRLLLEQCRQHDRLGALVVADGNPVTTVPCERYSSMALRNPILGMICLVVRLLCQ